MQTIIAYEKSCFISRTFFRSIVTVVGYQRFSMTTDVIARIALKQNIERNARNAKVLNKSKLFYLIQWLFSLHFYNHYCFGFHLSQKPQFSFVSEWLTL